jgi:hypothetical protein
MKITQHSNKIENSSETRDWSEVDADEQEYLDRLSNFGEGYVNLAERFEKKDDLGLDKLE